MKKVDDDTELLDTTSIQNQVKKLELSNKEAIMIICNYICATADTPLYNKLERKLSTAASLLAEFTEDDTEAQKGILAFVEIYFFFNEIPTIRINTICMELHVEAIIDEEVFFDWAAKPNTNYIANFEYAMKLRLKAAPFLTWLRGINEDADDTTAAAISNFVKLSILSKKTTAM